MPTSLQRALTVAGAAGAAVATLRALSKPLPVAERRLLDWEAVRRTAVARTGETGPPLRAPELGRRYDAIAAELAPLMAEVLQTPVSGFPPFSVVDRRGFVEGNLVIVQRLFEPVERLRAQIPESRATAMGRSALSRYVGELFGFLSRRVLGQYDPVLLLVPAESAPTTALYLVEPNVVGFERRHDIPAENLRRWLILHEVTHAWQFEAHPWLRDHLGELMNELLMNQLVEQVERHQRGEGRRSGLPTGALLRSLPGTMRTQLRAVGRVQAVMSVAEGYSNFVMHQVGRSRLPDFDRLEAAFHARSAQRPLLERLVLAITGLNMKMRQYEVGERFAEAVAQRGGLDLLNRVWEGPELMPSVAELQDPDAWVRRAGR